MPKAFNAAKPVVVLEGLCFKSGRNFTKQFQTNKRFLKAVFFETKTVGVIKTKDEFLVFLASIVKNTTTEKNKEGYFSDGNQGSVTIFVKNGFIENIKVINGLH